MNPISFLKQVLSTVAAVLWFVLLSAMQPALAGTPINQTVAAAANGNVRISSVAGSVKVEAWNRNEIHVGGTLSAQAKRLAVESTSGGVDIRVILPENSHGNDSGSHLVVQLPAASNLHVGTVSADVSASGVSGPVDVNTVSGGISVASTSADLSAKSVSGDVETTGSAPNATIDVHSISGGVVVRNVRGSLNAGSVSGDIRIDGSNVLAAAQLETTSGDIDLAGGFAPGGNYKFNSVSGDVKLVLQAIPAASFDASSFSGDITTSFGPAPQRTSEYGPGREWHYPGSSGKGEVSIHTLSGDIRIQAPKP